MIKFWKGKKIVVTGGSGFLGSHLVRELKTKGADNIFIPRSKDYDLRDKLMCREIVKGAEIVIHLAANVGGIGLNQEKPGELFYDNLIMGVNLMEEARLGKVQKFVGLGTICEYPKFTPLPFKEDNLWDGYPEETNAPYGLAKKMLLVQAQAYRQQYGFNAIHLMPVNLYGPGDNFDPKSSHVIPALIKKFIEGKEEKKKSVEVWGDGNATREFLYIEDAARAIVMAVEKYNKPLPVNIGSAFEISVVNLAQLIKEFTGFQGGVVWDKSKPNGQPRRKLDTSRAEREFGFKSTTDFNTGLKKTIKWYLKNRNG